MESFKIVQNSHPGIIVKNEYSILVTNSPVLMVINICKCAYFMYDGGNGVHQTNYTKIWWLNQYFKNIFSYILYLMVMICYHCLYVKNLKPKFGI